METKNDSLPPVQDSIALSSRESAVFFDVRRNGGVCLFSEYNQVKKRPEILLTLEHPEAPWRWREGWLPFLQIGSRYELAAVGDELWVRDGDSFRALPEGRRLTAGEYCGALAEIEAYWRNWLSSGLVLPPMTDFADAAWRSSLIQALCMFVGKYPVYGAKYYRLYWHDGFPPNVLTMTETLLQYEHRQEALEIYLFYFERFVRADGSIDYYGPSIAEYGALMWLGAMLMRELPEQAAQIAAALKPLIRHVLDFFNPHLRLEMRLDEKRLLIAGSPEADEHELTFAYFHNNYHLVRGLEMLAPEMRRQDRFTAMELDKYARFLKRSTDAAFAETKAAIGSIPYYAEQPEAVRSFRQPGVFAFANYRYYPELLESGYLSGEEVQEALELREAAGGEYAGTSYLGGDRDIVDNWPMAAYGRAMLEYGDRKRFMRFLRSHLWNYIARDTFAAYEQIFMDESPRTARAAACVPCQLLLPRLLAWSRRYRKWDGTEVCWGGPDAEVLAGPPGC